LLPDQFMIDKHYNACLFLFVVITYYRRIKLPEHLTSHEADRKLKAAKDVLKAAQKRKAAPDEIKKLKKDVANAQAVRNLF
jgi:hypothetical protein